MLLYNYHPAPGKLMIYDLVRLASAALTKSTDAVLFSALSFEKLI